MIQGHDITLQCSSSSYVMHRMFEYMSGLAAYDANPEESYYDAALGVPAAQQRKMSEPRTIDKRSPVKKHQLNIYFSQNIVFMNILIIIFLLAGAENGT